MPRQFHMTERMPTYGAGFMHVGSARPAESFTRWYDRTSRLSPVTSSRT